MGIDRLHECKGATSNDTEDGSISHSRCEQADMSFLRQWGDVDTTVLVAGGFGEGNVRDFSHLVNHTLPECASFAEGKVSGR